MKIKICGLTRAEDARPWWQPSGWRHFPIHQAPLYPEPTALRDTEARLNTYPSLVFEAEVDQLRERLARVGRGEAFLLQGGDCAESFADFRLTTIRDNFRILLQMAIVLTFGSKLPIVKIGRVAGQFAKPRSSDMETRDGQMLPAYRGDIINGHSFTREERAPDPRRMEKAYFHAATTLNLLRALAMGGLAEAQFANTEFYTSHEALLLNYEEALTRPREINSASPFRYFAGSAHMVWIGERTRQIDGAHVEYARGIANPIGLKCGPDIDVEELLRLSEILNPGNEMGRLTLIPRMGADRVETVLPPLVRRLRREGRAVVWCCDPMHGNTYTTASGFKTRSFTNILSETRAFFAIHHAEGSVPGGVHFELTGRNVTECTGGSQNIHDDHLSEDLYESRCDPRLNATQALEFAFAMLPLMPRPDPK